MTDDDRTIDADDGMLDELRRLAADARSQQPASDDNGDETVDADESTMDLLRQFAADAKASSAGPPHDIDETPPAGIDAVPLQPPVLDTSDLAPPRAPASSNSAAPLVVPPEPSGSSGSSQPPPLPSAPDRPAEGERVSARSALPPLDDIAPYTPVARSDVERQASPPTGDRWRPPPRMVMPTEPERAHRSDSHRWRVVSIGLAVALAVALAILGYMALSGDDAPGDDVPDELPADSVPGDSSLDEPIDGGDGG